MPQDQLDIQEKQPEPAKPAGPHKLTPAEAVRHYRFRAIIFAALFLWFGYDGWFNEKFQAPEKKSTMWFNRVGAVLLLAGVSYHGTMFLSAVRAAGRENQQPQPPSAPTA